MRSGLSSDSGAVAGWGDVAPPRERGAVLLEAVLALPALLAVAVGLGWCVSLVGASAALGDVAREAARALARGEPVPVVIAAAQGTEPGLRIHVTDEGPFTTVVAERDVAPPVPLLEGLDITLTQTVTLAREST